MDHPLITTCRESGAMVFHTPQHIKDQQEGLEKMRKVEEENSTLKHLLGALVSAQSASVKSKLPQELLDLAASED